MNHEEYARMDAGEESGWWFAGKRWFVAAILDRFGVSASSLLDAGCGTGAMLRFISRRAERASPGPRLFGLDPAPEALAFARTKSDAELVCGSAASLPFRDGLFQLVLFMDVLEHLDDDRAAIAEAWRVLKPGGHIVITVPAYQFLWCDHDEALHHRRRYRVGEVIRLVRECGLEPLYAGYAFCLVFPVAAIARIWRRLKPPESPRADIGAAPPAVNTALRGVMRLESLLLRHCRLPFGTSVIALARKSPENGIEK